MTARPSLLDYDCERYGPFLGISDEGSAAAAIRDAALGSPKARALGDPDPLQLGVAHDAERLRSVGEVPVGPDQYERIRGESKGRVLLTTNVGSHVNVWHYLEPPALDVTAGSSAGDVAAWAADRGAALRDRRPQPWLRLRFATDVAPDARAAVLGAAAARAPVCIAVRAEHGVDEARRAVLLARDANAPAVVVEGAARPPTAGRPALPGLLNHFAPDDTRGLLRTAREAGIELEPALKIDTDSVANQIWTGLYAARAMGLHLGKYGLFPLTFREMADVVGKVQGWLSDWAAAPAFYVDVPWVDGDQVYELRDAPTATRRWLELVAAGGARVVLVDTVDKAYGRRLVRTADDDESGIFTYEEIEELQVTAARLGVRVLWAGGIPLTQVRHLARRRVFGVYVTTAAAEARPLTGEEQRDIGLIAAKEPVRERIALVKLLLEAGFLDDPDLNADAAAAEGGDRAAEARLYGAVAERWRVRLGA